MSYTRLVNEQHDALDINNVKNKVDDAVFDMHQQSPQQLHQTQQQQFYHHHQQQQQIENDPLLRSSGNDNASIISSSSTPNSFTNKMKSPSNVSVITLEAPDDEEVVAGQFVITPISNMASPMPNKRKVRFDSANNKYGRTYSEHYAVDYDRGPIQVSPTSSSIFANDVEFDFDESYLTSSNSSSPSIRNRVTGMFYPLAYASSASDTRQESSIPALPIRSIFNINSPIPDVLFFVGVTLLLGYILFYSW